MVKNMNIVEIIEKKKDHKSLTQEEIEFVIQGYLDHTIEDYQMSSLLMAIVLNGMTEEETIFLTTAMLKSGETLSFDEIEGHVVDKHSTGGVGDKTTLVVAPLVASCGVKVAKMSGRGLGHTGGTIDKLESIPGFQVNLSKEDFFDQVRKIGMAIVSQTANLVPADKKIYALRDVTGTVSSIPLIASSIMSKKLASGADSFVLDVKVGKGALLKTKEEAKELANLMIKIGKSHGKKVVCVLSNMEEPLGYAVGNALEVQEAITTLDGNGPKDLTELSLTLASIMVSLGRNLTLDAARLLVEEKFYKKEAAQLFQDFVQEQHGNLEQMEVSKKIYSLKSSKTGWVKHIDALKLGEFAQILGAGRQKKEDNIDYTVGFVLNKKVGDYVLQDEELMKVYYNQKDIRIQDLVSCFQVEEQLGELEPLIYEVIE